MVSSGRDGFISFITRIDIDNIDKLRYNHKCNQPIHEEAGYLFGIRSDQAQLTTIAGIIREDYQRYPRPQQVFVLDRSKQINLGTAEGCFELLLYAILLGAKVQQSVVSTTFWHLRQAGLTRLERLKPGAEAEVLAVLSHHYRALTPHRRKAAALVQAAERIRSGYHGDIRELYGRERRAADLVARLRQFPGIDRRAYWFCREMKYAGVWPDLDQRACLAIDHDVKIPLWFLGFVGADRFFLRDIRSVDCLKVIDTYFGGDVLPLVALARRGCRVGDSDLCRARCAVFAMCQVRFDKSAGCF